jgi:hypothetical protein
MTNEPEGYGQLYALGFIEKLRDDLCAFDGAKDELYYRIFANSPIRTCTTSIL